VFELFNAAQFPNESYMAGARSAAKRFPSLAWTPSLMQQEEGRKAIKN
jgi:hypothetical protein